MASICRLTAISAASTRRAASPAAASFCRLVHRGRLCVLGGAGLHRGRRVNNTALATATRQLRRPRRARALREFMEGCAFRAPCISGQIMVCNKQEPVTVHAPFFERQDGVSALFVFPYFSPLHSPKPPTHNHSRRTEILAITWKRDTVRNGRIYNPQPAVAARDLQYFEIKMPQMHQAEKHP